MRKHKQDYFATYVMEKLRDLRLKTNTSVELIAQQAGVTQETVRIWENSPLPKVTLAQLADYALACGYMFHNWEIVL